MSEAGLMWRIAHIPCVSLVASSIAARWYRNRAWVVSSPTTHVYYYRQRPEASKD